MDDDSGTVRVGEFVTYVPEEGGRKRGTIVSVAPYMIMRDEYHNVYVVIRRAGRVTRGELSPNFRPASSELISRIGRWMRLHQPLEVPRLEETDDITTPTGVAHEGE